MRYITEKLYSFTRSSDNRTALIYKLRRINPAPSGKTAEVTGKEQLDLIAYRLYGRGSEWYRLAEKNAAAILALRGNTDGQYRIKV